MKKILLVLVFCLIIYNFNVFALEVLPQHELICRFVSDMFFKYENEQEIDDLISYYENIGYMDFDLIESIEYPRIGSLLEVCVENERYLMTVPFEYIDKRDELSKKGILFIAVEYENLNDYNALIYADYKTFGYNYAFIGENYFSCQCYLYEENFVLNQSGTNTSSSKSLGYGDDNYAKVFYPYVPYRYMSELELKWDLAYQYEYVGDVEPELFFTSPIDGFMDTVDTIAFKTYMKIPFNGNWSVNDIEINISGGISGSGGVNRQDFYYNYDDGYIEGFFDFWRKFEPDDTAYQNVGIEVLTPQSGSLGYYSVCSVKVLDESVPIHDYRSGNVRFLLPRDGFKDNSILFNFWVYYKIPFYYDTDIEDIQINIFGGTGGDITINEGEEDGNGYYIGRVNFFREMNVGYNQIQFEVTNGIDTFSNSIGVIRLDGFIDNNNDGLDDRTGRPDAQDLATGIEDTSTMGEIMALFKKKTNADVLFLTMERLNNINTLQGEPPIIKIPMNNIFSKSTENFSSIDNPFSDDIVFIDFSKLEEIKFMGFSIIQFFRLLIGFGFVWVTLLYVWNKIVPSKAVD